MAQYDGSIRINTKIDSKEASSQLMALENRIKKTADKVASLRSKMESLKGVQIPTQEYAEIQKQIESTEKKLSDLVARQEKFLATGGKESSSAYKKMQYDVEELRNSLPYLQGELHDLVNTGKAFTLGENTQQYADLGQQLQYAENDLSALIQRHDELIAKNGQTKSSYVSLGKSVKQAFLSMGHGLAKIPIATVKAGVRGLTTAFQKLGGIVRKVATGSFKFLGNVAKNVFSKITKSSKQSGGAMSSFGSRLKSLALSALIFNQISKALNSLVSGIKEGFGNLYKEVNGFKSSVDSLKASALTLKNSLAAAFRPLVEIAIPYIQKAIEYITRLADSFGQLMAAITGQKTYTKAIKQTTAALEDAKEVEEGYLNPLDEVNKYKEKVSQSGAGGASSTMFEEDVPIKSAFLDMYENIKALIENQDWEGLGAYIAGALNRGLQKIYEVINWENVGPQITYFVTAFTGAFNGLVDNLGWDLLGRTIGAGINTVVNTLNLLITGIDWVNLGNGLAMGLNGLANEVDFTSLGMLIGNKFMILPSIALGFVQNLDWSAIGTAIGNALNGIVGSIDLSAIGTMLGTGLTGIFQAAIDFAATFDWEALGTNIFQGINAFFESTDWATVGQGISSFALGMLDAIIVAIDGTDWKAVGEGIVTMLKNIDWVSLGSKLFEAGLELIKGLLEAFGELPAPVQIAIAAIGGFFAAFKVASIITGVIGAIQGVISVIGAVVGVLGGPLTIAIGAIIAIGALLIANWDEIKEAAGKLKDWLVEKWEGVKKKTSEIWNSIGAKLSEAWNGIKNVASTAANAVKNGVTNAWNALKSATSNIWNGIMNVIKRPINGILGFVESLANGVVNAINTVIRALNRLSFDIPSWVPLIGGNHFGFNIPELSRVSIPRLATGTVVPPNREFMAVLGDNKREPEVVSPLSTMKQAVLEAIAEAGGIGEKEITIKVPVYIGDKQVYEATVKYGKTQQMSTGKNPFLLGTT